MRNENPRVRSLLFQYSLFYRLFSPHVSNHTEFGHSSSTVRGWLSVGIFDASHSAFQGHGIFEVGYLLRTKLL